MIFVCDDSVWNSISDDAKIAMDFSPGDIVRLETRKVDWVWVKGAMVPKFVEITNTLEIDAPLPFSAIMDILNGNNV